MTSNNDLQSRLGYQFSQAQFLEQALTHKSFHFENLQTSLGDNERLEFIGDAVLDLVIGHLLMKLDPDSPEGALSKKRAYLVSETGLYEVAELYQISQHIRLGKGEVSGGGTNKPRIVASAFEAIIGAMFLDAGYAECEKFIENAFTERAKSLGDIETQDEKSRFQELVQEKMKTTPNYKMLDESGPDHQKSFLVGVYVHGRLMAQAWGKNKKSAEREAAKIALEEWKDDQ